MKGKYIVLILCFLGVAFIVCALNILCKNIFEIELGDKILLSIGYYSTMKYLKDIIFYKE